MIKYMLVASAALLCSTIARSQPGSLQAAIEYQDLYSTHSDHFRGGSVTVSRWVKPRLQLGIGVEYTAASFHLDNDWNLYHLRFVPVFADERLHINRSKRVHPFVRLSEGVTYISYAKEILANPGPREQIHEAGIYLYSGAGFRWRIWQKVSLTGELGIKGFHMSFNSLDVNPHGITGRVGLVF